MPDNANAPAGSTPSSDGQSQPGGGFSVPDGHELLSSDDAARYRRYESEVRGFKPYHDTLSKYGLKSQGDFEKWAPFFEKNSKYGYTPEEILSIFPDNPSSGGGTAPQGQAPVDAKAIRDEILGEVRRERAESDHSAASKTEEQLLAEAVSKVAAGGDPDLIGAWFREKAAAARKAYDDNHPLKGKLSPLDKSGIDGVVKAWQERAAKIKGAQMAGTATRANKPVATPAGSASSGGKPGDSAEPQSVEDSLKEMYERRKAGRNASLAQAATV